MDDQFPRSMDMSTCFTRDIISRARNQMTNKNSEVSCMQHALVAACEGKLNMMMLGKRQDRVFKFSAHNLIFGCSRYLSRFKVDAHRGLDFRYGLRSWFLFPVHTTVNGNREKNTENRMRIEASNANRNKIATLPMHYSRRNRVEGGILCLCIIVVPSPVRLTDLLVLYTVDDKTKMGEQAFDKAIAHMFNHGPVVATLQIFEDYDGGFEHDKYIYNTKQGSKIGYHAVVLVGFNKDFRCFTYMNSHGEGFGNLGRGMVNFDLVVEILAPIFNNQVLKDMDASRVIRGEEELSPPPPPRGEHDSLPPAPPV